MLESADFRYKEAMWSQRIVAVQNLIQQMDKTTDIFGRYAPLHNFTICLLLLLVEASIKKLRKERGRMVLAIYGTLTHSVTLEFP